MTPQEVFDKAYLGVVAQGKQCKHPTSGCLYKLGDMHCAAGHVMAGIIPKDSPVWTRVGLSVDEAIGTCKELAPLARHVDLLRHIQKAHDEGFSGDFLPVFKRRMGNIANKHGLKVPPETFGLKGHPGTYAIGGWVGAGYVYIQKVSPTGEREDFCKATVAELQKEMT